MPGLQLGFPPFPAVYPDGTTWASNLARSDIDILIYQDGASCGFDFDGATPNDCRATWNSWEALRDNANFEMANIAARHAGTGKHFWSMIEMWRQDASGKQTDPGWRREAQRAPGYGETAALRLRTNASQKPPIQGDRLAAVNSRGLKFLSTKRAAEAELTPIGLEDDVTYAGNGLLVIHALTPGDKTLRWQGPCDVVDLTQGETVARQVESITIRMHAQETRWCQRGSAAERE